MADLFSLVWRRAYRIIARLVAEELTDEVENRRHLLLGLESEWDRRQGTLTAQPRRTSRAARRHRVRRITGFTTTCCAAPMPEPGPIDKGWLLGAAPGTSPRRTGAGNHPSGVSLSARVVLDKQRRGERASTEGCTA